MQKKIKLLFLFMFLITVSFSASAQIYVRIRPVVPVITVRPPQPTRAHVWIDEEWDRDGRGYRYSGGHWATPPHRGYIRTRGHWQHTRRGDRWIQGGWRRR